MAEKSSVILFEFMLHFKSFEHICSLDKTKLLVCLIIKKSYVLFFRFFKMKKQVGHV
ncbi:hypothetical protein J690_1228 [Acinetobacter sp. 742879]|nr:hypothetical protein J507_1352 [Acinetobacter sp. 1295259]EXB35368.1 hypothetical protein J518_0794 [Acinetobacter baumannii 1419130]EXB76728.1 hypothetical protein J551_2305 [Acinetobacter sp. 1475718]EXE28258.1 hypothetical protein J569_0212 [Acinetobacter sp. 907131]EXI15699.1 hypothetical protein J610_2774 [Acinetobacter sp. 723929]EXS18591.1 hypothetical protein J672_0269 [Acinetobacter sp. 883425]EXS29660.1 hypothetical protein J690_1228 [Acinetobacter sp. 742879]KCX17874.1 hypothet